jgi:hypothetical protein
MAFALFYYGSATNAGGTTTATTLFGTSGYWRELPDAFPPILWIDTSTPGTFAANGNQGCYVIGATTNVTQTGAANSITLKAQVAGYKVGTRWFRTTTNVSDDTFALAVHPTIGSAGAGLYENSAGHYECRLYYRAINEGPNADFLA